MSKEFSEKRRYVDVNVSNFVDIDIFFVDGDVYFFCSSSFCRFHLSIRSFNSTTEKNVTKFQWGIHL